MNKSNIIAATTLFFLITFFGCSKPPPTEEGVIRGIIDEVAEKASAKDIMAIKKHISKSYRDRRGNDYQAISGILLYHFWAEKTSVYLTEVEVSVEGEEANAVVKAILTRGKEFKSLKDLIPDAASYYQFDVVFRKEDGKWLVRSGDWKPASSVQEGIDE
ncbi:MAG: hypothetical protein JSU92_09190 [Deltaproteobacteria bacterium]|nr:MAG: hypothetical protein JSU92_09190 [Deltaproteobacteria bacterium]